MARPHLSKLREDNPHFFEIAAQYSRMVEVAIIRGDKVRAYHCVDLAFQRLEGEPERFVATNATPLDLMFGEQVAGTLGKSGLETVGQLLMLTVEQLTAIRQIRGRRVRQIIAKLAKHGLYLRGESEWSNATLGTGNQEAQHGF